MVAAASSRFAGCLSDTDNATVSLKTLIASSGRVLDASAGWSSPDDSRMRDCAVGELKALVFPSTGGANSTPLAFELYFERSGGSGPGRRGGGGRGRGRGRGQSVTVRVKLK